MRADTSLLRRVSPAVAAALLAAACLSPVDPDAVPVGSVEVTFDGGAAADTIQVRGTTRARAVAIAGAGYVIGPADVAWTVADTTIAIVDAFGVVRGVRAGTTRIVGALPDGIRGEATIVVTPTGIAYTIAVGRAPGALAFSTDYTRLYVTIAPDSLAIVDALGHFRLKAVGLGLAGHAVAATSDAVLVSHPEVDSVSVLSPATDALRGRIWVGAGPTGVVATRERAFVAARYDRRVVIVEDGRLGLGIPVGGEPHALAVARDGRRLFATVARDGGWRLAVVVPAYPDTLETVALPSAPTALATSGDGSRVYVLLGGEGRVLAFAEQPNGRYVAAGSVDVGAGAAGLSVHPSGSPLVVSGEPTTIVDTRTLTIIERVPGVGTGAAGVRPDGVFTFVAAPGSGVLRVIGL